MPHVVHQPERTRFVAATEAGEAVLEYTRTGQLLVLSHTEVPEAAEGQGVGGQLAQAALDHARAEGFQVMPLCPFVKAYVQRHPEERDLVMPGFHL